ncbi:hypothetical protein HL658_14025 [Azospirillum sp. RWY-5-1]|uniref:Uncharacterized protein n=1 Tax=Azospirillum oleiclasticum TaxID=2735135 RepID=A0ABX2T9G6_9PROT|nr:hypothetical protein [Azospirillum oleiclasticum]NYZ13667.1 hypothetical protein [Azospirillum oleiclasticum]NYZ20939.1 hypothetical protein [Azospirillum oleiclasticum]
MPSAGAEATPRPLPPEIPDDGLAPPAIAAVYDDIRATTGNPIVNLVFRRLAAEDVLLDRVWSALRPHYADGTLDALAGGLLDRLDAALPAAPAGLVHPLGGVDEAGWPAVRALVRGYLVNNARNLIATRLVLVDDLRSGGAAATAPLDRWLPPVAVVVAMPPFPDPGSPLHRRIATLNRLGDAPEPVETASLWRHLAHWPALLDAIAVHPPLLDAAPALAGLRDRALGWAGDAAAGLPRPAATPAERARLRTLVGPLAEITIPKMLPIGLLLDRAPPPPRSDREGPQS